MRLASSRSSGLPVSFHQPSTISARTFLPVVDQPLDRLGDLVLAAPRRLERVGGLQDRVVEQVDADERQVADGSRGFSTRRTTRSPSSTATPKRSGSGTRARKICASGRVRSNSCTNRREPLEQHVVAQVHQERLALRRTSRAVSTACARPSGAS